CALVMGGYRECDIGAGIHGERGTRLQLEDSGKLPAAAQEPQRVIGESRALDHGGNTENVPAVASRDACACRAGCAAIAAKKSSQAWRDSGRSRLRDNPVTDAMRPCVISGDRQPFRAPALN